jgi:hypothetical protein
MVSSGYRQSLRWGNETRYGSAGVINKDIGAVQSVSPSERNNLIKIRTLGGNRDYKTVIPGKFEITGSFEYYLQGGAFLRQAFGEDTATTSTVDSGPKILSAGGSVYRHVMGSANSPGVNSFPSFTLEFTDEEDAGTAADTANLKRTYTGCRVNTLNISGTVDEPVRVSVDWMAKRVTVSTALATPVSEYTQDPFIFYDGFVYLTSGDVTSVTTSTSLKSSALCQVMSFDFNLNNNLETHWYISGTCSVLDSARSAKHIIPKGRDYELRLGMHYTNRSMYQRFLGAANAITDQKTLEKVQIVLDMAKSGTPVTVASGDHYMRMVLASSTFDDIAINGSPEDIVNNDVTVFCKKAKVYFVDSEATYK